MRNNTIVSSFFLLIIVFLVTLITVDYPAAVMTSLTFLLGILVSSFVAKGRVNLYVILFVLGWVYMLLCYRYMLNHGFSWLLAFDAGDVYVPTTQKYLNSGNGNYGLVLKEIFSGFNPFDQRLYGYWSYLTLWGLWANILGVDLYFALQVSTLFVYPFVGLVFDKLLRANGIDRNTSFRYSIIVCVFSIIFFYSSQILRDIHILLFYLMAIRLSIKEELKLSIIVGLLVIILVTCLFRIESGLFLFVTIPVYLLSTLRRSRYFVPSVFVSIIAIFVVIFFFYRYLDSVVSLADSTYNAYMANVPVGVGIISRLQRIPLVGDVMSVLYNAVQPVPFWRCLSPSAGLIVFEGEAAFNIMNITRGPASFMNLMTIVFLFAWLLSEPVKSSIKGKIKTPMKYQLLVGLVFLYIQAAVIDQRRLMGYYCVFYSVFFILYTYINPKIRTTLIVISVGLFISLQLFGFYIYG